MTEISLNRIEWQESLNGVTVDCALEIAVHIGESNDLLLIIPGVDGSLDGYENKYKQIAESINSIHGATVIRMDNPFITSHHWESNVRRTLDFVSNHESLKTKTIRVMAHSAGASIIGRIAWEYPEISHLLLINPATRLGFDKLTEGLERFSGEKHVLVGDKDPAYQYVPELTIVSPPAVHIVEGADHNFTSGALEQFIDAPHRYLFRAD
jgi:pimeloyl-ACP methyl ester carboxylesterase